MNNQALPEEIESDEKKIAVLDVKHKALWVSLVQMDPIASMVQYQNPSSRNS
jgi:hypothetical protein